MQISVVLASLMVGCSDEGADEAPSEMVPEVVGNTVRLQRYPPVVVATVPETGSSGVGAVSTDELTVVFSKPMNPSTWAWVTVDGEGIPIGSVRFDSDTEHRALGVKLEPDETYLAWLNDPFGVYNAFQDERGRFSLPYPFVFSTGSDTTVLDGVEGAVVETTPPAGTDDVDPDSITRVVVRYSKAMSVVDWLPDEPETELPITNTGLIDGNTAFADVELERATTYAVELSGVDTFGISAAPYLLTFRTSE
ncbi:MAG: Ig-like domain-containing protein [Myxococcota bacterium]